MVILLLFHLNGRYSTTVESSDFNNLYHLGVVCKTLSYIRSSIFVVILSDPHKYKMVYWLLARQVVKKNTILKLQNVMGN